ncbi:c-type cytochrome [uncultured Sphingomonas sp.]|uniref:c-type cytochrome n=1 Tax=uncultured Sphingomonas sp. TaxID=158754 RepID=UPI002615BD4B|nr:c-type cytochrome [uncultured Sphingomonas sp.]
MRKVMLFGAVLACAPGVALAQSDAVFAPCAACHSTKAGENRVGPTLRGIVGRPKGSVAGFSYSTAMKSQKGVWTEAALDMFIANPRTAVPGTRMIYAGMADKAQRGKLVAYLKSLK